MPKPSIDKSSSGQHPSELMVSITTSNGKETLIVDKHSVVDNALEIGYPVGRRDNFLMVELPRETMSGQWRVLVPDDAVSELVAGEFAA